jgi:hypothetical protein
VHARQVAEAAVATAEDDPAPEGRLQRQQQVEAVDPQRATAEGADLDPPRLAVGAGGVGAGRPLDASE